MIAPWRKFLLVLIMLWLPLQGAMAANMSLCKKDKDVIISLDTPDADVSITPGMLPCAAEKAMSASSDTPDIPNADQSAISYDLTQGIMDEVTSALQCDGTPCQASCTAPIPSTASSTAFDSGSSYALLFNSRFTSLIPEQLHRPPLV